MTAIINKSISFLFLIFLILPNITYTQEYEEDGDIINEREFWFYEQRSYPDTVIKSDGYKLAAEQKEEILGNGFFDDVYEWSSLGPTPGYMFCNPTWTYMAGRVSTIAVHPTNPNIVYIGASGGGVWKTSNGGTNWTLITGDLGTLTSGALAIDPQDPNIIYYGTGHYVLDTPFGFYGLGLYKSTNGGTNWTHYYTSAGFPEQIRFMRIIVKPGTGNNNILLAATDIGLYRSTNAGINWSVMNGTSGKHCTDVIFSPDGSLAYCIGPESPGFYEGTGYMISTNGGANFTSRTDIIATHDRSHLAICQSDPNRIYLITLKQVSCEMRGVIYKSINAGYNFSEVNYKIFTNCNGTGGDAYQWNYDLCLYVSPVNPEIVFWGIKDLWRSTNGGSSFSSVGGYSGYVHADIHNLAFDPNDNNGNTIYVGSDGGINRSTNLGSNWTNLNPGLSTQIIYRIASSPSNPNIIVGGTQDGGIQSKYSGILVWRDVLGCNDGANVVYSPFEPNIILGSVGNGGVYYKSTDAGNSFGGSIETPPGDWGSHLDWIAAIAADPTQSGVWYTAKNLTQSGNTTVKFYKSTNNGTNWGNPISSISAEGAPPQHIVVSKNYPNLIYLSTGGFKSILPTGTPSSIYKTTNGGISWNQIPTNESGGFPDRFISRLALDPATDELFVTVSGFNGSIEGHLFRTTNDGANWRDMSGDLPDVPVNDIVIQAQGPGVNDRFYIVGTDMGCFSCLELGNNQYNWFVSAGGLPNAIVTDLEYLPYWGKLRASTYGSSVWQLPIGIQSYYVTGTDYIPINNDDGVIINNDIIITTNSTLKIPYSTTLKFASGKKIIVQSGGQIDVPSGQAVTFTSQSGEWGGIEFQGTGYGTLSNCTFNNTTTPITVTGNGSVTYQDINITGCTFNNSGPIQIDSRPKVNVQYCTWNYTSASTSPVIGVFAVNSNETNVSFNNISYLAGASFTSGIWITYGEDLVLHQNTITNSSNGIYVGNSSPFVSGNTITNSSFEYAMVGMSIINCYSPTVKNNMVTNYQFGLWLENSSPIMYSNVIVSENTVGMANTNSAMDAEFNSNAILSPAGLGGGVGLEEAGNNKLRSNQLGEGIHVNYSLPVLDYGNNTIYGMNYYIEGTTGSSGYWYARCNNWVDNPVDPNKFVTDVQVVYDCPGGGGGENDEEPIPPPEPYIINYGHGVYDTIRFINRNMSLTQDKILFSEGSKLIYDGSYTQAISKFQQVIQNYQDSSTSVNAMKKIIFCYDKMNADTSQYNGLRNYYLALAQNNPTDSAFVKVATELAAKCMVRNNVIYPSITEYENIITNSSDSLQILNSELNVIQLYMIAPLGENTVFAGKYESLRPGSKMDGVRMIGSKIFPKINKLETHAIPKEFKLYQNYPNPFNPITKIKFELPNDVNVTIKIYDLLGREVASIVRNEFRKAGRYEVEWNAGNFASGVYFYTIDAGKFRDSKKMVLIK